MEIPFFPLSWHVQESEIQIFGWSQDGEKAPPRQTCLRVSDFSPFMYIKLPQEIQWTIEKCECVIRAIKNRDVSVGSSYSGKKVEIRSARAVKARGVYSNNSAPKSIYIHISFGSEAERAAMKSSLSRPLKVLGIGMISLKCYEYNASAVLQLICRCKISSSDWFQYRRAPIVERKISKCEREYIVSWSDISPWKGNYSLSMPRPLIMGYDIETYSHDPSRFCDAEHDDDVIFQISVVFGQQGSAPQTWEKYILSLGDPVVDDSSIQVIRCKIEKDLLRSYVKLVDEKNPHILIGYNTFGFDNRYMLSRAKLLNVYDEFVRHGCTFEKPVVVETEWASSAYGTQKIFFLDTKGRVHVDLLVLISRDFKLDSYKLGNVAQHFLGRTKDPLTHYDIYDFYRAGTNSEAPSVELGVVAKYCVKDSVLVVELFEHLKFWYSLTAMAKICYVPMAHLFQRGQGIKVFSQVYKYCFDNGIVVENNSFKMPTDDFVVQGAFVLDAVPGLYHNAVSFDFASLYPSIIISHNICYSTLVKDDDKIDDSLCHIVEWEEHFGCGCVGAEKAKKSKGKTTIVCANYKFRWLREPAGILPSIITNLLDARKKVKKEMTALDKSTVDYILADQLQNSFKISANSMYGILASKLGPLAFPVGGMCVTAIGRRSLREVKRVMESEFNAKVVYGDTDSNYVVFRGVQQKDLDAHCYRVAAQVSARFPKPMKLEYEQKIYQVYFLLTKKRYAFLALGKKEIEFKGILLKRRDSSKIIRDIYRKLLMMTMNAEPVANIYREFFNQLAILMSASASPADFAVSSSLKDIDKFDLNPKSALKVQYGSYTVSKISDDPKKRAAQLKRKGLADETDYYQRCLPGHVQLALRMRERGQTIQSGSRLSMIYVKSPNAKAQICEKLEELEYFEMFFGRAQIDTLHYAELLITPVKELLEAYTGDNLTSYFKKLYETLKFQAAMIAQLKLVFKPLRFEGITEPSELPWTPTEHYTSLFSVNESIVARAL